MNCQFLLHLCFYIYNRGLTMSYNYDSIVSRSEVDALKEMIFQRARERATQMNNETQESYTTSFKNEIMDIARKSFVAERNPFSINEENNRKVENNDKMPDKIRLAKQHAKELKEQIDSWNKIADKNITDDAARIAMNDARESLKKNTGFMGALEFLNSQATISLINKKDSVFNAIA